MFVGKAPRIVLALLLATPLALTSACEDPAGPGLDGGDGEVDADDLDGDGIANNLDPDIDGDGIANASDFDIDGDRIPNEIDDDVDGDGIINADDDTPVGFNPPGVSGPWADPDGDGIANLLDPDDNNDGMPDGVEGIGSCDGGITVATDESTDCDGFCLIIEGGLQPCDDGGIPGVGAPDTDGDGIPDSVDPDDDNDGIPDGTDTNPRGNDLCVGLEGPPPPGCFPTEEVPDPTCSTTSFTPAEAIPPRILLVVDRSASMNSIAAGFPGSKWNATVDSLVGPADASNGGVVGQLEQRVEFGLLMYPAGADALQCVEGSVSDNVTLQNHADIRSILRSSVAVGGTPTATTLGVARNSLNAMPAAGGQRAVILATDGGPNCNESLEGETCRCVAARDQCQNFPANCLDDTNTIAAAAALNLAGFPVFVLGLDGALSFSDVLTRTAQAGGTSNFFSIGSSQVLAETIEDIALRVGSCRYTISGGPSADKMEVSVDGQVVGRDTNHVNGWDLTGVNTVEFFGAACDVASRATQNVAVKTCF